MILLDTNVLSELAKASPDSKVGGWTRRSAPALAVPTMASPRWRSASKSWPKGRREELLEALRRLLIEFADRLFDFTANAAWAYGRFLADARRAGRPRAVPDAAIAATAEVNGCALATRNVRDFATTGLELIDPWRSET